MTIELLIQAVVRQTMILVAQLATLHGVRAPLAQIADQVFNDLVRELERLGVSRKVSADMFGLGLRTYRRKIHRSRESLTERGRTLWEALLDYVRSEGLVTRGEILARFSRDDEDQIRSVLRDLRDGQLIFSSGTGARTSFRAASQEELSQLHKKQGEPEADELQIALMYREGTLTLKDISERTLSDEGTVEAALERLAASGRIQQVQTPGQETAYRAEALTIPLGAPIGWEAAVFDHFKAVVATIVSRLREQQATTIDARVGGSTYTIDVWREHPLEDEVYTSLSRLRTTLSELRDRVNQINSTQPAPEQPVRVVVYVGQYLNDGNPILET